MICKNPACKKETTNPKYCSRSCAATVNGRKHPKRKPEGICANTNCTAPIPASRTYCDTHAPNIMNDLPIKDLYYKNGANKYNRIRGRARTRYSSYNLGYFCAVCRYDKHIQVCHIRPISDFPEDASETTVNGKENLVGLCPNCHWEFDNGLLTEKQIRACKNFNC